MQIDNIEEDDYIEYESPSFKKDICISLLKYGDKFQVEGVIYRLLRIGQMGAYVQVVKGESEEDGVGAKVTISGGSMVRVIR